jgi:Uma2 family endonuclease
VALDEGDRRELVDGELVEVEVPTDVHEYIVSLLGYFLTAWARPRRAGFALASGFKVRISAERGVMPDLQFYRTGNRSAVRTRQGLVQGCPDVAVEIVSESSVRHDRVTKLAYYASIGVPEYWIVDPSARTVERLVLQEDGYLIAQAASGDEMFCPASFDGLAISLAELWTIPDPTSA